MPTAKRRARRQGKAEYPHDVPRSALVPVFDPGGWREKNEHLYRNDTSLRWFLRHHRDECVKAGALFRVSGRFFCIPERMEAVVREIGARVAAERGKEAEVVA